MSNGRNRIGTAQRRVNQEEDDELLAKVLAQEEDELIARKLQSDFDAGTGVDDFHRPPTSRRNRNGNVDESQFEALDKPLNLENRPGTSRRNRPSSASQSKNRVESRQEIDKRFQTIEHEEFKDFTGVPNLSSTDSSPVLRKSDFHAPIRETNSSPPNYSEKSATEDSDYGKHREKDQSDEHLSESEHSQSSFNSDINYSGRAISDLETEIKTILQSIDAFKPDEFEPDYMLKPFIPELFPSIGDIDPVIRLPAPNTILGNPTNKIIPVLHDLGLKMLDEPNIQQSDPAVLDIQLRALHFGQKLDKKQEKVHSIQLPTSKKNDNDPGIRALNSWLKHVNENISKTPTASSYSDIDIEQLMEAWPAEIEQYLSNEKFALPAEIDLPLKDYLQLCCNLVGIPVQESIIKKKTRYIGAAANLMALYLGFKNSQHFAKY